MSERDKKIPTQQELLDKAVRRLQRHLRKRVTHEGLIDPGNAQCVAEAWEREFAGMWRSAGLDVRVRGDMVTIKPSGS